MAGHSEAQEKNPTLTPPESKKPPDGEWADRHCRRLQSRPCSGLKDEPAGLRPRRGRAATGADNAIHRIGKALIPT